MAFHEVSFPDKVSYGTQGGPGFRTNVVATDSGYEERVQRWGTPRRQYNAAYGVKSHDDLVELRTFYIERGGQTHGFRFKDYHDYTTKMDGITAFAFDDQAMVRISDGGSGGDGTSTEFQLVKRYINGPPPHTVRNITKPVVGSVAVGVDGVDQGDPGSGWSVNSATGVVTFDSAPGSGLDVTGGCNFEVPVRFGEFDSEVLWLDYETFASGGVPGIPMVEIIDGLQSYDEFNYGGAITIRMTSDATVAFNQGRVVRLVPSVVGRTLRLGLKSTYKPGGPIHYLINDGSESVDIRTSVTDGGALLCALAVNEVAQIDFDGTDFLTLVYTP